MGFDGLRFEAYDIAAEEPNVVVDGSPNGGTVLTLTHWPGFRAPDGLADDLSAQMAFRYLDRLAGGGDPLHGDAEVVTNNHFDQDGTVGVYALAQPESAMRERALLEDVAAAGDFGTYRDRRAARLSMVMSAFTDTERSPAAPLPPDYGDLTAHLYGEMLGRLPEMLDDLDRYRDLWGEEDRELDQSEAAIASGDVAVDEHPDVDLVVVTVPANAGPWSGHRFGGGIFHGIHPMAINNASDRAVVLVQRGRHYELTHRYETWVQYRTRRPRPRVDLQPLAARLTELESEGATWEAGPVGDIMPQLHLAGGNDAASSLDPAKLLMIVRAHLAEAPPAWDPYDT